MRRAVSVVLTDVERQTLQSWSHSRTLPARLVTRAKIVLLAGEGVQNNDIAAKLRLDRSIVARWRNRFAQDRLDGIAKERCPYRLFRTPYQQTTYGLTALRPRLSSPRRGRSSRRL